MGKFFKRLLLGVAALAVAAVAALIVVSGAGSAMSSYIQGLAGHGQPTQQVAAPAAAQANPQPSSPVAASATLDFEVNAPTGFKVDYSVGGLHHAETVDATGHWKGRIDNLTPGPAQTILTVTPPKSPAAPYRASCGISYDGKAISHNESDEKRAPAPYVQCMAMISPR